MITRSDKPIGDSMASNYLSPPSVFHIKAFLLYRKAVSGDVNAQEKLANLYYSGKGVRQSYESAFQWYTIASESGSVISLFKIGNMYLTGSGVNQSDELAFEFFYRAYTQGHTAALKSAINLLMSKEVFADTDKKIFILSEAHELGDLDANIPLAKIRLFGDESYRSYSESFTLLNEIISMDSPEIDFMLGYSYEFGLGVSVSNKSAYHYYLKAAKTGHTVAKFRQGLMLLEGRGVTTSKPKAMELISSSAKDDYPPALMKLGEMYEKGDAVTRSPEQAIECYRKAAQLGIAEAYYRLGELYRTEESVQDYKESMKNHSLATAAGYQPPIVALEQSIQEHETVISEPDPEHYYETGRSYETGTGYNQSYENALICYTIASDLGHTEACYSVGRFHSNGLSVPKDNVKALEYYSKASK